MAEELWVEKVRLSAVAAALIAIRVICGGGVDTWRQSPHRPRPASDVPVISNAGECRLVNATVTLRAFRPVEDPKGRLRMESQLLSSPSAIIEWLLSAVSS